MHNALETPKIMAILFAMMNGNDFTKTCDTCKTINPKSGVTKDAIAMFAAPEVIRQAAQRSADRYHRCDHLAVSLPDAAKKQVTLAQSETELPVPVIF